ncbi:hypothetical protein BDQ12DRAFT_682312, partial [Crucibulum laeve]
MPGKHVHFAPSDYISTPTPSYSYASLPSSAGSSTPSSLGYFGSPYGTTPLPAVPCQINPALLHSGQPLLAYNVSYPVVNVQRHPSQPYDVLMQPATHPPVSHLTLSSPYLLCSVEVTPQTRTGFITVNDVLECIYQTLRQSVTENEFSKLSPDSQRGVSKAYQRRYERIPDPSLREIERQKGLKRVDFLEKRNVFMGLSGTKAGPDVMELHL